MLFRSGNELENNKKKVTYKETYGDIPELVRDGYAFLGWYTEAEGGERVTAEDKVLITTNVTLYAHWRKLKAIPRDTFTFTSSSYYYDSGIQRIADYNFTLPEDEYLNEGKTFSEDGFTIRYKSQSKDEYEEDLPSDIGVYEIGRAHV